MMRACITYKLEVFIHNGFKSFWNQMIATLITPSNLFSKMR